MHVLITGGAGFVGSHLTGKCLSEGHDVTILDHSSMDLKNLESVKNDIKVISCDICDYVSCQKAIAETNPEVVFHLAAISFVPDAQNNPGLAVNINVSGTFNVLEASRKLSGLRKFIFISSSEVYGKKSTDGKPINESLDCSPVTLYAVTKQQGEILSLWFYRENNMPVVIFRPFNHVGPRQSSNFVVSSFARQIAEIEAGKVPPVIKVGNLSPGRDFSDVRDIVEAYVRSITKAKPGEIYNLCSGVSRTIQSVLDDLLSRTKCKINIKTDSERIRKNDDSVFVGDSSKFTNDTGWCSTYEWDNTLDDLLEYWRRMV